VPEIPPQDDPITSRPMSLLVLISAFILLLTVAWSLYSEFFGLRPWRSYQDQFREVYSTYLQKQIGQRKAQEQAFYATPQYEKLKADIQTSMTAAAPMDRQIQAQIDILDAQRAAITDAFQTSRGKVGAVTYDLEQTPEKDKSGRESELKDLNEAKAETYTVNWPDANGVSSRKMTADELGNTFTGIMSARAALVAQRGDVDKPAKDSQNDLDEYVKENLPGLGSADLAGLLQSVQGLDIRLRQINVNPPGTQINYIGGVGLVDRCQSCHVATDPLVVPAVMTVTKADLGLAKSNDAPFASHPDPELLKDHALEKFGCSPCHGGNGRALDSVEKGHGRYEHWLWPLYYPANYDAGCQQCHASDSITEHAPVLNTAKQLYREKGCIGCHKFQGFDNQDELLTANRQKIVQLEDDQKADRLEVPRLNKLGDSATSNDIANRYYQDALNLTVTASNMDAQEEQLENRSHDLQQEIKKVGPDLKEVRFKIHKEWIPNWLEHTHEWRPTTKMPQFRLQSDEVQAIAAFIWQSGLTSPELPKQAPGNAEHGKQLVESRGCLACHSIGEGTAAIGGTFAANLSRVGEKDNYDYLVRWVHNPRERSRPYDPFEKKDLGPDDYAKHNLPFVFDEQHSRSPDNGHELVVMQPTVMPSLRLSEEDSRDVASYLITLKHPDARFDNADFMDDPKLKAKGKTLVQFYGCAGCHEISGMEDEGRIGTELTNEGSKPIERLDFALLTEDAKEGSAQPDGNKGRVWYDLKGFFENKLTNPAVFDTGKYKPNPQDRLRMPKPNVNATDIDALTTMLLGSTDPTLPPDYMYKPADERAAIQQGWWIVTKYNCMGCHQIDIGQRSVLMDLPMYQGQDKIGLPPVLTSEGARVNPEWLKGFLNNPALSTTDTNRDGVRSYLQVRMPTFFLSDDEIRSLVLFFGAISHQAQPFIQQQLPPLTTAEVGMARQLFTSTAAPCLKCHATGDPAHDKDATAPNFLLAKERLRPAWTERWITNPQLIIPGTAMPSGLFNKVGDRWVFSGPVPASFNGYTGDHASLLVRYMFQLTPDEQRALLGRTTASNSGGKTQSPQAKSYTQAGRRVAEHAPGL
jgi:cytochrome c551/c552